MASADADLPHHHMTSDESESIMPLMELVLLADLQNSFASDWIRVANTSGLKDVHIGDRFREQGQGAGLEELEVDGLGISDVGGLSRLHVIRGGNATQPMTHRLGAVLEQVGIAAKEVDPAYQPLRETINGTQAYVVTVSDQTVGDSLVDGKPIEAIQPKRGRGRPPGSKNKAKEEVAFPAGF